MKKNSYNYLYILIIIILIIIISISGFIYYNVNKYNNKKKEITTKYKAEKKLIKNNMNKLEIEGQNINKVLQEITKQFSILDNKLPDHNTKFQFNEFQGQPDNIDTCEPDWVTDFPGECKTIEQCKAYGESKSISFRTSGYMIDNKEDDPRYILFKSALCKPKSFIDKTNVGRNYVTYLRILKKEEIEYEELLKKQTDYNNKINELHSQLFQQHDKLNILNKNYTLSISDLNTNFFRL